MCQIRVESVTIVSITWPSYSIKFAHYLPAGRKEPEAEQTVSLKQENAVPPDVCCSLTLAAPECAPSAPTSSGEEPVQSYHFKSRKGYSLQVGFISGTCAAFHEHPLTIAIPGQTHELCPPSMTGAKPNPQFNGQNIFL